MPWPPLPPLSTLARVRIGLCLLSGVFTLQHLASIHYQRNTIWAVFPLKDANLTGFKERVAFSTRIRINPRFLPGYVRQPHNASGHSDNAQ